jgi:hypothetical protein
LDELRESEVLPHRGETREQVLAALATPSRDARLWRPIGLGHVVYLDSCAGRHQFPHELPVVQERHASVRVLNANNKVEVYNSEGLFLPFGWGIRGNSPGIILSFARLRAHFTRELDEEADVFVLTRHGGGWGFRAEPVGYVYIVTSLWGNPGDWPVLDDTVTSHPRVSLSAAAITFGPAHFETERSREVSSE